MIRAVLRDALPAIAFNHLWIGVYLLVCGEPGWAAVSAIAALVMIAAYCVLTSRASDS